MPKIWYTLAQQQTNLTDVVMTITSFSHVIEVALANGTQSYR